MRYSIKNTFLPLFFAAMMIAAAGSYAQAQGTGGSPQIIAYPIAELGSCGSKETCKKYCDEAANQAACLTYAESHGLMSKASVAAARVIIAKKGPGGCSSKESCTTYCQSSEHTDECVSFAQKFGALATTTASLIKKIKIDGGPGGCKSSEECKTYCKAPAHLSECREFAQTAGITKKPADTRITALLAEKPGPGGCTTQEECKTYCSSGENGTECRQFAVDNKLITQDQFDKSQKAATLTGPGGCQGQECKTYCQDSEHKTECYDFAVKNGLISKENAETAQSLDATLKTSSGPGGCTSPDSCRAYCSDASHSSECQAFISRHKAPQGGAPGNASTTVGAPRMLPPQPGTAPAFTNPEEKARYCKEHPGACGAGSGSSTTPRTQAKPPIPTMPPKPTTTNPTGTSGTANLTCRNIDECRVLCAKSAAECAKLPPDMQKYILSTKPSTVPPPINTTTTTPPPTTTQPPATDTSGSTNTDTGASSATVAACNTLEECKILCTKNPAACASFPPETLKYILNSGTTVQPPQTQLPQTNKSTDSSSLGAAIFIGLVRLLGF